MLLSRTGPLNTASFGLRSLKQLMSPLYQKPDTLLCWTTFPSTTPSFSMAWNERWTSSKVIGLIQLR